jgi:tetratricopeptide (TPR) repeat protein
MIRLPVAIVLVGLSSIGSAQFVPPTAADHNPEPGLYTEDPFIVQYRQRFFAVFKGDFATFERAYAEVQELVRKDPKDARALVWVGNGQTVAAGLLAFKGKREEGRTLLAESRETLDRAVALRPRDPNIYMMRAATLYIQGEFWKKEELPPIVWERLRDDCRTFIRFLGPDRIRRVSVHVRGEAYGEMGVALLNLGDNRGARAAFEQIVRLCPGTKYEERAKKELAKLDVK